MTNLIYLIVGIGVFCGMVAVLIAFVASRMVARRRAISDPHHIRRTDIPRAQVNVGALMGRLGASDQAHFTLGTAVMRISWGMRLFGVLMIVLIAFTLSLEATDIRDLHPLSLLFAGGLTAYALWYLIGYEVSYDENGLTAPDLFFRRRTHAWADFIDITQADDVNYKLVFETGTVTIKKFLVGLPTFLKFVTDVRETNRRV